MKRLLSVLMFTLLFCRPALTLDVIQNVARSFVIEAPALDKTDGVTPETSLTMTTFVIKAYKKNKAPITITATTAVFATATLTSDATNPTDGDTLTFTGTLDGTLITEVYRFKDTLAQANDVKIEANAATTLDSLLCAVNDSGCVEGTDYGTGTVASVLVNATTNTDTTQLFVADIPGTLGNSFTIAESSTHLSVSGANMGSTTAGVDGMLHDASGYHWFCAPATTWDTLGDMLLTFNYNAEAAPFFQKVRVVAARSNEIGVQGLGATTDELLETNLNTVASSSAWAYKLNQLDIATSAVWNELLASHTTADSFGERLTTTAFTFGTADSGSTTTVVDTERTEADTDYWNGNLIQFTSGTITGQTRVITGFNAATDTITFSPAATQAVSTNTYKILGSGDYLRPTTTGRQLDVSSGGEAGVDWANVGSPTTSVTLSGTTVGTVTTTGTTTNLTNLPTIPTNWITANGINADAFTAAKFAADASTEFATTLFATTYEGAHTFKHFLQYGSSALFGKYNSSAGTFNFRDLGDSKNRIVYTTTSTSRATVTLSPD